jgi:aspartate beta-hydroxylase
MSPPTDTIPKDDARVSALMVAFERARAERQGAIAERAFAEAEALNPEHPAVLDEKARRALRGGDPRAARALIERAIALAPSRLALRLGLARVLRVMSLNEEEIAVLDAVLRIEPLHSLALLWKADALDRLGRRRAAARVYGNALETLGDTKNLPPDIDELVERARRRVLEGGEDLARHLEACTGAPRAPSAGPSRRRFDRAVEHLVGRRKLYPPRPTFLHFPFLANHEFHPREDCPWLAEIEASSAEILDEFEAVYARDQAGLEPYIAYREGLPLGVWEELNHSRRWSAYFLLKEGRPIPAHATRCPATLAALAKTPQVDIPGYGPTAFFSILHAGTRIPPHHGVTNTRLTVHLPLVVPPGCGFRVGGETREWRTGTAFAFDDTIEHEAWNESNEYRAVLIFDVWNPQLSAHERDLVREMSMAVATYYESEGGFDDGL